MSSLSFTRRLRSLALVGALLGCSGDTPSGVDSATSELRAGSGVKLVRCENLVAQTGTLLVDPLLGGSLDLPGVSIAVPAGAVTLPTVLSVTVPVSKYAEVEIHALDVTHFLFAREVTVTIDYSRCARPSLERYPLVAWYVDSETMELLERMGGTDDKVAHRVTFTTGHLSSYALAE